jgi:hypothetical protein
MDELQSGPLMVKSLMGRRFADLVILEVWLENPCLFVEYVNSNLVQYLLQTDIQKRTEKIQWKIQTLHRDFSPGNPNRENQHILYSYIVLHCLQYNIHIGAIAASKTLTQ